MPDFNHKDFLRTLTHKPGVYQMSASDGVVIYVGKASNLKKRISSYFNKTQSSPKTRLLVAQINNIEITVTKSEGEALLLESNLIKKLKPRYNILFRDDKSYPYLYLSTQQEFPRLSYYRGARSSKGRYFGPYPDAGSARETLNITQKLFQIRQCEDTFFRNRTRPCLQYQIKRCSAPCVGYISQQDYAEDVTNTRLFLEGKNEAVINALTAPMQQAADLLEYERAAHYRDQISNLRKVLESQYITGSKGESDIIASSIRADLACLQLFCIRGGRNLGNKTFYPKHSKGEQPADIISAFLSQYYLASNHHHDIPCDILLSHKPADLALIQNSLSERAGKQIKLGYRLRGQRAKWMAMAIENTEIALQQQISSKQNIRNRLEALKVALDFQDPIERIECFDISHTRGEATVASCVVFGTNGPIKSDYRRFNIQGIVPGDDYAAMRQVIERRYTRVQKEEGRLPDIIFIDGGKGQIKASYMVLEELQLGYIPMIGIAKGTSRKPGLETLILSDAKTILQLAPGSAALHLIQEVRDEAHRFAITGHQQNRKRQRNQSPLEQIEGIGSKRRQQLIRHFGGSRRISRASIEDIAKVPGISKNLAEKIYNSFHGN